MKAIKLKFKTETQERDHKLEIQENSKPLFDIDPPDRLKTFKTRYHAGLIESRLYESIIRENPHKW